MRVVPATGNSSKALLFLAGACLCFGTSGTAQALGPDDSSPLVVGAARLLLGAIGLFALIKFREPKTCPAICSGSEHWLWRYFRSPSFLEFV